MISCHRVNGGVVIKLKKTHNEELYMIARLYVATGLFSWLYMSAFKASAIITAWIGALLLLWSELSPLRKGSLKL